jgi:hypothetical protein
VEKTSDVANPSKIEKTSAVEKVPAVVHKETSEVENSVEKGPDTKKQLSEKKVPEKKVPEKKAPEKSKLPAAPSNNEPTGGSEEASESSDEEAS